MAVLCRGTFAGPARISAMQWPAAGFAASVREFHRNAGLLEGGLLVLSAFVFVTAIINREWLYVLFATWLVASLRLGAISAPCSMRMCATNSSTRIMVYHMP